MEEEAVGRKEGEGGEEGEGRREGKVGEGTSHLLKQMTARHLCTYQEHMMMSFFITLQ